jgi:hypothetical protein
MTRPPDGSEPAPPAARLAPSLRPASLVGPYPLRPLPDGLSATLEARRRAGYEPAGADYPRRERWQTRVAPALLLGSAAAVALIVALIVGRGLPAAIAGGVLVACSLAASAGLRWMHADPLRISPRDKRALDEAGHWESRQPWTYSLMTGSERAVLDDAVDVTARIAANPAWRSDYLQEHRQVLDLAAELDQVDQVAFTAAQAAAAGGATAAGQRALAVARVQSLRDYDAGLDDLAARIADLAVAELPGQLEQSAYSTDVVARLTEELGFITGSLDRVVPRERP